MPCPSSSWFLLLYLTILVVMNMARIPRVRSKCNIYHILLRSINRETIFNDEEDIKRFLITVNKYKKVCGMDLFAYCVMSNHIHLLVRESGESISDAIKRISSSYVFWYNSKYERCGHLFQGRFKSEAVESEAYFLTVLRYIHQKPVKAGIARSILDYQWSSYREYFKLSAIVDSNFALEKFAPDRTKARRLFQDFNLQDNDDVCLDDEGKISLSDSEVKDYLKKVGIKDPLGLKQFDKRRRDKVIRDLKLLNGVTIRQISRLTGISKSTVDRV